MSESWSVQKFRLHKISIKRTSKGLTLKQSKGRQPLFYATHLIDLIYNPIKYHEDILKRY